jgi:hypothetical protein
MDVFASKNDLFFYNIASENIQKMRAVKQNKEDQQQNGMYDNKESSSLSSFLNDRY